jgi:hypothetical protein
MKWADLSEKATLHFAFSMRLEEKKKHGVIGLETELSSENSKSVDYGKFKSYLVEKDKLNKKVLEFYQRETWRKMKFRQYSYGKKSMDNFLNKIKETFVCCFIINIYKKY